LALPSLACALLGSFLSLLEAIEFALDGEDLGVVEQAIDQGDDAGGVWKDLAPFGEWPVVGDECQSRPIASEFTIWKSVASGHTRFPHQGQPSRLKLIQRSSWTRIAVHWFLQNIVTWIKEIAVLYWPPVAV
jgi:hypothetical protein